MATDRCEFWWGVADSYADKVWIGLVFAIGLPMCLLLAIAALPLWLIGVLVSLLGSPADGD